MSNQPESAPGDSTLGDRVRRAVFGPPRDVTDKRMFHKIALVPLLAWVGLGADGLSSSCYGPEEAFRALGDKTYLALGLAALTAFTVCIISAAYSRIIELFPEGGGGYVVATALLGPTTGAVAGSALLIDYVLTITVSIAAAGDALFSFLPVEWRQYKIWAEALTIVGLVVLNIRGTRESIMVLVPIFVVFLITHVLIIFGGIIGHVGYLPATLSNAATSFQRDAGNPTFGLVGMFLLFMHAYSLGGGTYTGIEAVSNGLPIMREPRVQTGKRTMLYMAVSLALAAAGLLVCYLIWDVRPSDTRTMNATLIDRLVGELPGGWLFLIVALLAEGALLVVAAQAGFLGGPRILAKMATDSWVPHWFASLSERLTNLSGIVLMGFASLIALLWAHGSVRLLVVLYSINVFLTFSLSMLGMLLWAIRSPRAARRRGRSVTLFSVALVLCATILVMTIIEKFRDGAWLTVVVTGGLVLLALWIRAHYRTVVSKLQQLYSELENLPKFATHKEAGKLDPQQPTAAVLVAGYGGLGIHTFMNIFRAFPNHFKNVVFLSVGVIDSGPSKAEAGVEGLQTRTQETLDKYVDLARGLGMPATSRMVIGTDVVEEAEQLCLETVKEFPRTIFFAGKVIFRREKWYQKLLHNETAFAVQKRLHWAGQTMVVLPAKVK